MGPLFRNAGLPTYHEAMLFVRMKPQPRQASLEATFAAARTPLSSGLQALCYYERAGLVKRVTPVSREAPHSSSRMLVRPTRNAGAKPEVLGVSGSDIEG
ncbi:hypothetical protein NGR_b09120 (plasmid) [Sinorhizobium fredii NGR234]|uniref:Uncharacterized protein n=1 Tax=Sinorhizobium fredii (strain NBRC 101917 / NGR234) TaxID=394 RepID=C3KQL0_SINFN|nr:hypothetical protein [Sinorhizobium fredii]ACP22368.1 hypothetical protein NGR_b09120 [Sinorhizobium fredii NGR234]